MNNEESQHNISIKPIGFVRSEVKEPLWRRWEETESEVIIDPTMTEALTGLEEFSHIIVVFWMHKVKEGTTNRVHPQRRADLPEVGLFATRTPYRPNPIGVTTVRLLQRSGNVLKVKGLDAVDGTPVLDIKPCFRGDAIAEAKVPQWVNKLK
jgi:tRNA-Thr(GGU) m(6)t(6)A37 methyltransferase TsaA